MKVENLLKTAGAIVLVGGAYLYWDKNKNQTTANNVLNTSTKAVGSDKYTEEEISKKAKNLVTDISNTLDSMLAKYGSETNSVQLSTATIGGASAMPQGNLTANQLLDTARQAVLNQALINYRETKKFSQAVADFKNISLVKTYDSIKFELSKLNKSDVDKVIPLYKKNVIGNAIKSFPKIVKDLGNKYEMTIDEKLFARDLNQKGIGFD